MAAYRNPTFRFGMSRFRHSFRLGYYLHKIGVLRSTAKQVTGRGIAVSFSRRRSVLHGGDQVFIAAEPNGVVRLDRLAHGHGSSPTTPMENSVATRFLLPFPLVWQLFSRCRVFFTFVFMFESCRLRFISINDC